MSLVCLSKCVVRVGKIGVQGSQRETGRCWRKKGGERPYKWCLDFIWNPIYSLFVVELPTYIVFLFFSFFQILLGLSPSLSFNLPSSSLISLLASFPISLSFNLPSSSLISLPLSPSFEEVQLVETAL